MLQSITRLRLRSACVVTMEYLKLEQRWYKLTEILNYLNIKPGSDLEKQLVILYRSPNPTNRIEYNPKTGM
jgi:transcription initiation factor TFIIE subunit beta